MQISRFEFLIKCH